MSRVIIVIILSVAIGYLVSLQESPFINSPSSYTYYKPQQQSNNHQYTNNKRPHHHQQQHQQQQLKQQKPCLRKSSDDLIRIPDRYVSTFDHPSVSAQLVNRKANRDIIKGIYEDSQPNYYGYYSWLESRYQYEKDQLIGDTTDPLTIAEFKSGLASSNYYKQSYYDNHHINNTYNYHSFELKRFTIKSYITDTAIISVYSQLYLHNGHEKEEGRYELPLPPQSVVSNFTVIYGDVRLQGLVNEKLVTRNEYKEVIKKGGQAFLAERDYRGYFIMKLGNIPSKTEVTIEITIVSEIGTHSEAYHYLLHRWNFPVVDKDYEFDLNIQIQQSSPIKSINMDGYPNASIEYGPAHHSATVKYYNGSTHISDNILVVITPEHTEKPQSIIEYNPSTKTYASVINFYPKWNTSNHGEEDIKTLKSEIIFVLDCSPSMHNAGIKDIKRALELIVDYLYEGVKFNLYLFGGNYVKLFHSSQPFNSYTRKKFLAAVSTIRADMNGDDLYSPIKDILSQPYNPNYPRQILIITDGQIQNRPQLFQLVRKEYHTTRIFTLGIGNGVDKELVIGLSHTGRGYFQIAESVNGIEKGVINLLSIMMDPIISNIQVNWGGLSVSQAPSVIRPAFLGERIVIYALFGQDSVFNLNEKKATITIFGNGPNGKKHQFKVPLDFNITNTVTSNSIHSLTAHKLINELEELEIKQKRDYKKEIVSYGTKFGLISKYTSYIVTQFERNQETEIEYEDNTHDHGENKPIPTYWSINGIAIPDNLQDSCLDRSAGVSTSIQISWSIIAICIISFMVNLF